LTGRQPALKPMTADAGMHSWESVGWLTKDEIDVLEDFVFLATIGFQAILPRSAPPKLVGDVKAALVASQLGVGLAHARREYVKDGVAIAESPVAEAFRNAYFAGKGHMKTTRGRFAEGPTPSAGVVFAEVALARLPATYFAAGLLFRTGHLFEAHAVLRQFYEQVAWAFAVREATSAAAAEGVSPTKAIGELKALVPYVGPAYGYLSKRTHLSLDSHALFLDSSGERNQVILRHGLQALAEGWLLLLAADCWAVVFERTQLHFMSTLENWVPSEGGVSLAADRPFLKQARTLRDRLVDAAR
jgi:hypothetical protein